MSDLYIKLTRTVNWLAGALAAAIALSFPLGFFALQYQSHTAAMEVEAEFHAISITQLINANPEFWQFEEPRLQELLKELSDDGVPELRRIVDAQGRVITSSPDLLATPVIKRTAALLDSGNEVGRFEVARSLRPLLLETAVVGVFGLLLGDLVLRILSGYPLRALKKALESLQNEKERAQITLQAISDAVITSDPRGQVLSFNLAAEKIFGYAAAEVVGRDIKILMPEPYRSEPDGTMGRHLRRGQANLIGMEHELTARRSDGGIFTLALRIAKFDLKGHAQFIGSMRDITERRQAREEILQLNASLEERVEQRTAELKLANQQLEAFSYSVSHDLRGPLSAVNGFSNLLEKALTRSGAATDRSQHYLARIRAGIAQMGELIDAMLSLAQVSRASLRWEAVDLGAQARALLLGFQEREPGRVAQWQVEPGLLAQGDPRLLRQVLDNLLGNAWKFSAGKACTCITMGQKEGRAGETVYFVQDNGAGFDMAYVEKLFGAFQRLHTDAEFPGTGIGLATVQRIIARHGGRVWADSTVGQGATFYFTLGAAAA